MNCKRGYSRLLYVGTVFFGSVLISACGGGGGGSSESSSENLASSNNASSGNDVQSSEPSENTSQPTPNSFQEFLVTTFNTGLLPYFVPQADERVGSVARAAAADPSDVLCLQEVWRAEDSRALTSELAATHPFIASVQPRQKFASQVPVCSFDDVAPVLTCVTESCLFSDGGFLECAAALCERQIETLAAENPECAQAVFAQGGKSVFEILEIQDDLFSSTRPAGLFAFEGSSGLLLASKHEIVRTQVLDLADISTTSRRAALFAEIRINGVSHIVGCTHLTSNLTAVLPYAGALGSWERENQAQADAMLNLAARFSGGAPEYLAGDFNCSVANGQTGAQADFPSSCQRFLAAGYRDAAAEQLGCSFCASNSLNQQNTGIAPQGNFLLDHVFTRNLFAETLNASRSFEAPVTVGGNSTNLSDHFGVRLNAPVPGP